MPQEFEGDLTEAVFWGADISNATFRDVNLTGARISHAWVVDVEVDALVRNLVINGVDVTDFVNQHDPWYPLRTMLRPGTPEEMRETWAVLQQTWATTVARAQALPEALLHQAVNGEFTFVETLRHLSFAMDKWFTAPILGEPLHPSGLPNRGSMDFPFPGLDYSVTATVADALALRTQQSQRLADYLANISAADFEQQIDVLENGPHPLLECLYTVFEEEFWHNRYALRDLAVLEASD